MHRSNGKNYLLDVLSTLISPSDYNEVHLPILEVIFDKLNKIYKLKLDHELNKMQALPSPSVSFKSFSASSVLSISEAPKEVVIEQNDMLNIFNTIIDKRILEKILIAYIYSMVKNSITCEYDLSKVLVLTLVGNQKVHDLQQGKHHITFFN